MPPEKDDRIMGAICASATQMDMNDAASRIRGAQRKVEEAEAELLEAYRHAGEVAEQLQGYKARANGQ